MKPIERIAWLVHGMVFNRQSRKMTVIQRKLARTSMPGSVDR
jgi:hypothetical protein